MFLGEIFTIQTQTIIVWPDPSYKNWPDLTWVKHFWPQPITNYSRDGPWPYLQPDHTTDPQ